MQDIRAIAIVLLLAAFAYLLYLWSKRKDQIHCPSCGARVNIYADECPHCGHQKGEPVDEAADVAGAAQPRDRDTGRSEPPSDQPDSPFDQPDEPEPADMDDEERPDFLKDLDEEEEVEAAEDTESMPSRNDADAAPDVDYVEVVSGTINEVQDAVEERDLDLERVLEAEKAGKNRVTLTDWLEERIDG